VSAVVEQMVRDLCTPSAVKRVTLAGYIVGDTGSCEMCSRFLMPGDSIAFIPGIGMRWHAKCFDKNPDAVLKELESEIRAKWAALGEK